MESRIETLGLKRLIGKSMQMSADDNKTAQLWQSFMPERHKIKNVVDNKLYSLQIYPSDYFLNFDWGSTFTKYAMCEVSSFDDLPDGMETLTLPAGLYAVFLYKGPASEGAPAFQYIFGEWLPTSDFLIDDRPHFELLGEKYSNNDRDSEEEIWIPVKAKE